jgi:hypothetical protein
MLTDERTSTPSLPFVRQPGVMTAAGNQAPILDGLPRGVADLAAVAHGLVIHEHIAPAYGVELTAERRASVHLRPVERILERLNAEDGRPLTTSRPADRRLPGNCRQFTVLLVAMLRAQGVPARARCGFGGYFGTGWFEDHWVAEYWHAAEARWVLADAQIDDVQRGIFPIDFDLMDVPRGRFLVAGDAWALCRAGQADPAKFGLSFLAEGGDWWIAGNLMRDVAALNNMELLPWDVWGAMPGPDETPTPELSALFDRLSQLTHASDETFAELRALYEGDERLRVPPIVFNAVLNREEAV